MRFFIEFRDQLRRAIPLQPAIAAIADDLQQPGTRLASAEAIKEAIGPQQGFLHYIFGIRAVTQKPSSHIHGAVQMWQYELLKPNSVLSL
jgi:hypothetical protein